MTRTWDDWGYTEGGAIFSIDPVDQARVLALGFHRILDRVVQADIPTVLLAFPRIVEDADYLFAKLRPVLSSEIGLEQARGAHRSSAAADLVRVDAELHRGTGPMAALSESHISAPSLTELDNIAMRRELDELRHRLAETEVELSARNATFPARVGRLLRRCGGAFRVKPAGPE